MARGLPKDLIKTTKELNFGRQESPYVDIRDIHQLWKVYATTSRILQDVTGRRLENLVWRIWSSKGLHQRLTGSILATLFIRISDEHGTNSTSNSSYDQGLSLRKIALNEQSSGEKATELALTRTPLPSILKKSTTTGHPGQESPNPARIIIQEPRAEHTAGPMSTTTASASKSVSTPVIQGPKQTARKKSAFAVNTLSRRNVLIRRKSSLVSQNIELSSDDSVKVADPETDIATNVGDKMKPTQEPPQHEESDPRYHHPAGRLSWESLAFLRPTTRDQIDAAFSPIVWSNTNRQARAERRFGPTPTSFNTVSIYHHNSGRNSPDMAVGATDNNPANNSSESEPQRQSSTSTFPSLSLIDPDFRIHWAEQRRRRQEVLPASTKSSVAPSPALSPLLTPTVISTKQSITSGRKALEQQASTQLSSSSSSSSSFPLYRPQSQLSLMIQQSKVEEAGTGAGEGTEAMAEVQFQQDEQ